MSPTPLLDKKVYLDYASFSPIDDSVLSTMLPYYGKDYGNPSSLHLPGRNGKKVLEEMRGKVAHLLSVLPEEIVFTGGGTEGNMMALLGIARAHKEKGNHIIISAVEHASSMETVTILEREGFMVSVAPVLPSGVLDVDMCISLITEATILVSVMYVNNEIGTLQPLQKLSSHLKRIRRNGMPFLHTDAAQASTLFPLTPSLLGVDCMTLNGGKMYGPTGVGILYLRKGVSVTPLVVGGGQEMGMRSGTENLPLIVGCVTALCMAQEKREEESVRLSLLREYFVKELLSRIKGVQIHGDTLTQSPAIVHVTVKEIEGESMLLMLDEKGVYVSTGSACASSSITPSHVLIALKENEESIHGSLRFSMGRWTTKEDIEYVLSVFPPIVATLRALSPIHHYTP